MISFPNAKINIGLNVVSKRPDGYHNLETVFFPVQLADALEVVEADDFAFTSSGIEIGGSADSNLVVKAWQLLKNDFKLPQVKIHLHKAVPFGAGLGGGSSDAAFMLKMLNDQFQLGLDDDKLEKYAAKLGADCPFFIRNKPVFAHGIGDQFKAINIDLSAFKIVIVKPNVSVSTADAYRQIVPQKSEFDLRNLAQLPIDLWKDVVKNDFENSVFPQFPAIQELKQAMYDAGAVYASMSGSGSAVFGIFRHSPINTDSYLPKGIFIYR